MVRISNSPVDKFVIPFIGIIVVLNISLMVFKEKTHLVYLIPLGVGAALSFYVFWNYPKHIMIHKNGITIRRRGRDEDYSFDQLKGIKAEHVTSRDGPPSMVLKVKVTRRWDSFTIDYGRINSVCQYLPEHLREEIKAS